jgi:hypothetical protein
MSKWDSICVPCCKRRWTSEEVDLLKKEFPNVKTEDIVKKLNRTVGSVFGKAKNLGLKKTREYLSRTKSEVSPSRKRTMERAEEIKKETSIQDLCYLAGLFDGEGSVTLYPKNDKWRLRRLRLEAQIANTNREVLEWIRNLMKLGSVYKGSKANKQCYHYFVGDWQATVFLEAILPYLKVKKNDVVEKLQKWRNQNEEVKDW